MAYMNQEKKAELGALVRAALAKWPAVKWSLSVRHHSTIVLTITKGPIDFARSAAVDRTGQRGIERDFDAEGNGSHDVNEHAVAHDWTGDARAFLVAAKAALSTGNHDRSDIQSDHFDVGWYVDIKIGTHAKPYHFTGTRETAPVSEPRGKLYHFSAPKAETAVELMTEISDKRLEVIELRGQTIEAKEARLVEISRHITILMAERMTLEAEVAALISRGEQGR